MDLLPDDRSVGQCTSRLDVVGGGMVAERTYNNSVTSIPYVYFAGSQTPSTPVYYDELSFEEFTCPLADLTGDCLMNMSDFSLLASNWLRDDCVGPDWCYGADIDNSGDVGFEDLAEVAAQWLTGLRP